MPWQQNRRTGEWREVDANGNPVQAPRPTVSATALPITPQRARDNARQDAQDAEDRAQRMKDYQLRRLQTLADLEKQGKTLDANDQIVQIPGWQPRKTAEQNQEESARLRALNGLVQQINRTQELGSAGPMASNSFLSALGDYLPTSTNKRFDTAGAQLSQQGLAAFKIPGTGSVSDRDAIMFDRANLPAASNFDASNDEILGGLRRRVDSEFESLGLPTPKWVQPSVWDQENPDRPAMAAQGSVKAAVTGETRTRYKRYPELEAKVNAAFKNGASLDQLNAILRSDPDFKDSYFTPTDYNNAVEARKKGNFGTITVGKDVPLTRAEEFSGSPAGAFLAGAGNMGSFGGVEALAGQQYRDIKAMSPNANMAGEILGSIGGSEGLGILGAGIAKRLPGPAATAGQILLNGGGKPGTIARQAAKDSAYGGAYGEVVNGDAGGGALSAGAGSLGGQFVGGALGRGLGGLTRAAGADELIQRGVPLTAGQNMGGFVKSMEDRATSLPVIGDMIGARRLEGLRAFNRAAFDEAGQPIGARINQTGPDGVQSLFDQAGLAYDDATAGVNVQLDPQFMGDLQQVAAQSRNLPPDLSQRFASAMDNRVQPIAQAGQMTGETYQQAMRGLKSYKAEMTKPGFEADYRDALSGAQDALKSQLMRSGGDQVVHGLGKADQAYRATKILEDAVGRARNGSRSGEVDTFMPSQLNDAIYANSKKFPGQPPLSALAKAGQKVLPSQIPDSGTAGRAAQMLLPTALVGGGGAGLGYATGGGEGAATGGTTGLALLAALALGGTKGGQKAINGLLFDRPAVAKALGSKVSKRKGLFGSASIPLMLESFN